MAASTRNTFLASVTALGLLVVAIPLTATAKAPASASQADSVDAGLPRDSRVPGGVAVLPVGPAHQARPSVTRDGTPVWVKKGATQWLAVVGLPLSTAPGSHTISVSRAASSPPETLSFTVKPKRYPVQKLKLDKAMVDPPAEVTARIERESAHLKTVRSTWRSSNETSAAFVIPAQGRLSSRFGLARVLNGQPRSPHAGLDVALPTGTPINAPGDGIVLDVGDYYFCGRTIYIDHGNGLLTLYCHLSEPQVKVGDVVKQNQRIGLSGGTGRATGPHLHWTVYLNGVSVEPELFLKAEPK